MSDDYQEESDEPCPHCGHPIIRWRPCSNYCCEDGWINMAEYDDPLLYDDDDVEPCPECRATGIEKWCPNCGKDPREKVQRLNEATP